MSRVPSAAGVGGASYRAVPHGGDDVDTVHAERRALPRAATARRQPVRLPERPHVLALDAVRRPDVVGGALDAGATPKMWNQLHEMRRRYASHRTHYRWPCSAETSAPMPGVRRAMP